MKKNIEKNVFGILMMVFMFAFPVLALAQTTPGWYFQGSIGIEGPFSSQQSCITNKNIYTGQNIGTISKDCYEVKTSTTKNNSDTKIENPIDENNITDLIQRILEGVIKIGMPIIVLAIIYSGFLFVSAQGNTEKLSEAKRSLLYTLIGAAILLGSWAIAQLITDTVKAL